MKPVKATENDLNEIIRGLKKNEWVRSSLLDESFYYTKKEINKSYREGDLWIIQEDHKPVCFLAGESYSFCIKVLNTKKGFSGKNHGKNLVDYYINYLKEKGAPLIWLECRPFNSITYWERFGFLPYTDFFDTIHDNKNALYVFKNQKNITGFPIVNIKIMMTDSKGRDVKHFLSENLIKGVVVSKHHIQLLSSLVVYIPNKKGISKIHIFVLINDKLVLGNPLASAVTSSFGFYKHNKETYSLTNVYLRSH